MDGWEMNTRDKSLFFFQKSNIFKFQDKHWAKECEAFLRQKTKLNI